MQEQRNEMPERSMRRVLVVHFVVVCVLEDRKNASNGEGSAGSVHELLPWRRDIEIVEGWPTVGNEVVGMMP